MADKLLFASDYQEGAHEAILNAFVSTQMEQNPGYGTDKYSASAAEKIKKACNAPDAQVTFITGGTQTNQLVIDACLQPYEGVVSAATGHVAVHEAGAIEFTGHKVLEVPQVNGKIEAETLRKYLATFYADANHDHMVFPGMVYISHPTEVGTLYTKTELEALHDICTKYEIPLYMDGARMAYGLMSSETDVDLPTIARNCDVFYIGGTKQGALMGEAVVIRNEALKKDFRYMIKQRGGMFAKGRLLGIQFLELFRDGAYFKLAEHADRLADDIRKAFEDKGYSFLVQSGTNQIFVIVPNDAMEKLNKKYVSSNNGPYDEKHTVLRFCTSWATNPADVEELIEDIKAL